MTATEWCEFRDQTDGPCNGWIRTGDGLRQCPYNDHEACPEVDQQAAHERYLRQCGFGRRYRDADPAKLLGLDVDQGNREAAEGITAYMADVRRNVQDGRGYMLLGTVGGGKTYALALTALAHHKARPGNWSARFVFCPALFSLLHDRNAREDADDLKTCDLLLLDDFGVEYVADWGMAQFQAFVEYRHANLLSTCITSNLSAADLRNLAGFERIISRWSESCDAYELASRIDLRRVEVPA